MNREQAEKSIAMYLAEEAGRNRPEDWVSLEVRANTTPYPEMAHDILDIIERACGQGADSEKVGNNFLTPKLKALDLYYAQKDGCPNGHPSGAGKICVDCVAQALAERSCEHDGIESVLLMFYRHIDRFGVDPKDRTEQSQSQVRCFDAYWKLKTEERSCGETACPHCQCTCSQCRNCANPSPPTGRTEEK